MPYISTKTPTKLSEKEEAQLRRELGKAIELIRGKTEHWLMLEFSDECRMAFRGEAKPDMAMVEVELLGSASREEYSALTARITEILNETLAISPDRIYVKYEEIDTWGYAGSNF